MPRAVVADRAGVDQRLAVDVGEAAAGGQQDRLGPQVSQILVREPG